MKNVIFILCALFCHSCFSQHGHFSKGDSLADLAEKFYRNRDYHEAIAYESMAGEYFSSRGEKARYGSNLNNIGLYFFLLGKYDSSLFFYGESLEIYTKLDDQKKVASRLKNIGIVHRELGNYSLAIDHYLKALEISQNLKDTVQTGRLSNEIGNLLISQGRPDKAVPHFQAAIRLFEYQKDTLGISRSLNNLGSAYFHLPQLDSALVKYREAYHLKQSSLSNTGIGVTLNNLGETYLAMNRLDSAYHYLIKALLNKKITGNPKSLALTTNNLAKLFLMKSDFIKSGQFLDQSKDHLSNVSSRNILAEYYGLTSQLYDSLGLHLQAYDYYKKWNQLQDSLFQAERLQVLNQLNEYEKEVLTNEKVVVQKEVALLKSEAEKQRLLNYIQYGLIGFVSLTAIVVSILALRIHRHRNHIKGLLHSLHHGVKNHLQIISALFQEQASVSEEQIAVSLKEANARIDAVIGIHRRLYMKNSFQYINQKEYLQELIDNNALVFGKLGQMKCSVHTNLSNINAEASINIGLIANEVITNAFKHSLSAHPNPEIHVVFEKQENQYRLHIQDNGGAKSPPSIESVESFGMQLIASLATALKGDYRFYIEEGVHFELFFQLPN